MFAQSLYALDDSDAAVVHGIRRLLVFAVHDVSDASLTIGRSDDFPAHRRDIAALSEAREDHAGGALGDDGGRLGEHSS